MRGCARTLAMIALIGVVAVAALAAYLHFSGFLAVDSCLDAGGSYHYDKEECSFTESYTGQVPDYWFL